MFLVFSNQSSQSYDMFCMINQFHTRNRAHPKPKYDIMLISTTRKQVHYRPYM